MFVTGWLVLLGFAAPLAWAAVELRRWWLSGWGGAWGRLVEAVLGAVLILLVAEGLGTVGLLRRMPLVLAGVGVGVVVAGVARRLPRLSVVAPPPARPVDRWAVRGAGVVVVGVGAQWVAWTAQAYRQGMTAYDALFYHGPLAAGFAQTGSLTRIHQIVPGEVVSYYPATTEAWHAIGIVAFHSDVLSPALNLLALGIALLAAWCAGRALGGAAAAVTGVALVLATPFVAISQPGSSFNDAPALAALLAAVAILVSRGLRPLGLRPLGLRPLGLRPLGLRLSAVAALAAGLAAGMKLSYLAPAGLLLIAAVVLAISGRRVRTAVVWAAGLFVAGGYWYVRNLVRIGNPLPGGPLPLPSPSLPVDRQYGATLLGHLGLSWGRVVHPGLSANFGLAWPLFVVIVLAAVVFGRRVLALVVLASVVAYAVTPVSGDPLFFAFNLRYTIPAQGIAALVVATRWVSAWAQRMLTLIFGAGVLLAWPGASSGVLRAAAWPSGSGHRVAAVAFVVAVVLVAACVLALPRVGQAVVVLGAVAGLVVASRGVWDRYGPARYAHLSGGLGPAWAWAQTVRDARIGVVGVYQQYPFYGPDLTNSVVDIGVPTPHGGWARAEDCATWRTLVDAGRYRYVVTGRDEIAPPPGPPPERAWTLTSGAARVVLETGTTDVFAIEGPLDPATCPAGSPGGPGPAGVP